MKVERFGQVIGIKAEHLAEYTRLHAAVWPQVLQRIHDCNMRNYSIFLLGNHTLFAYFEYVGDDFEGDMAAMAADPITQEWWSICGPMQNPLPTRLEGEWWHTLREIFHTD